MKTFSIKKILAAMTAAALITSVMVSSVSAEPEIAVDTDNSVTLTQEETTVSEETTMSYEETSPETETTTVPDEEATTTAEETAAPESETDLTEESLLTIPEEEEDNDNEIALTAADGIEINETNFPDEAFRNFILSNFDNDNGASDGVLSTEEISRVKNISISSTQIKKLDGIKHFTAVENFLCNGNNILESIDLSDCTSLRSFSSCQSNSNLKSIDLSGCTSLMSVANCVYNSSLKSIDLSGCTSLTSVANCTSNSSLENIDVSGCAALQSLQCWSNDLKIINLKGCTSLMQLVCFGNQLTSIDLSDCSGRLGTFVNINNGIGNTFSMELESVSSADAGKKFIAELAQYGFDVNKASNWTGASYENGILTISSTTVSYTYNCGNGDTFTPTVKIALPPIEINNINFPDEAFRNYISQNFDKNGDGKLSYEEIDNVKIIYMPGNAASAKGIECFYALATLYCQNTSIDELDLSSNTMLDMLYCSNNSKLKTLNVKGLNSLRLISCSNNPELISLDLSNLASLGKDANINIANNSSLRDIDLSNCTSLKVLDIIGDNDKNISLGKIEEINLSGCTNLERFNLQYNKIETINLRDCTNLISLNLEHNELKSIDLTGLTKLNSLIIGYNHLIALDTNGTSLSFVGFINSTNNEPLQAYTIDGKVKDHEALINKLIAHDDSFNVNNASKWRYKIGNTLSWGTTEYDDPETMFGAIMQELVQTNNDGPAAINDYDENYITCKIIYEYKYNNNYNNNIFAPTITFTIGNPTGNLEVSNIVTGTAGDKNKDFTFTVTLDDDLISGTYGDMNFTKGTASFTLKDGESKTAIGLPSGIRYTVTESDNDDYDVSSSNETGTIAEDKTAIVKFINNKDGITEPETTEPNVTEPGSEESTAAGSNNPTTTVTGSEPSGGSSETSGGASYPGGRIPSGGGAVNNNTTKYTGEDISANAGIKADHEELSPSVISYVGIPLTVVIAGVSLFMAKKRRFRK